MSINFIFYKKIILLSLMVIISSGLIVGQDGPDISIWYGDEQSFGQQGVPQRWVNILGHVADPDGVNSLSYTLNGSSNIQLSIGPDNRRLQSTGDFNIDLNVKDLNNGTNTVVITATDNLSNQSIHTVTVNYTSTNVWPLPYDIDWQAKAAVNDVSQAVDGDWEITPAGIHTVTTGYDRLVAIGDTTWDDYEITVPVTIHSISGGNGVGVLLRWMGHTDYPVSCAQPKCGYLPLGAICWYRGNRLEIYGNDGDILATQSRSLDLETIYLFKARVETNPGIGGQYSFKVWKQGETEPDGWDITAQESLGDPQNGSLMLISHHGDVTFGNLSVSPIPISITNVQTTVHSGNTGATISWSTSVPANSQVDYGLTPAYELGSVTDPTLGTSHSMELTGLMANTGYHYQISSITAESEEAITGDLTFTTMTSDIVSDDFHLPLLNTSLWTFVDPVGDCDYDLVGSNTADAWLNFDVPAGTEHQLWTSGLKVPHVRQNCNNADFFEVEAKFESPLNLQYQEQGILVRQDDNTFLRFEFFSNGTETHIYVASFVLPGVTTHADIVIGASGIFPLYMRVKRQNNQWTMSYSIDNINWLQGATFSFAMTVTGIGPYSGNAVGGSSPAHTGSIDYFFNTASPVVPEDPIDEDLVIITSTPVTSATIGQLYTYDVDADGTPAPTYSLITAPTGMSINSGSGLIEWTPVSTGYFDVSVQASNTIPSIDIQDFVVHVTDIAGGPVSDDFNYMNLNETVWSFIDPMGGSTYTLTGNCTDDAWINISVPGGTPHELWTSGIMAPHILQTSGDTDFELEVKFESSVSGAYQEQGILIKEDDANFLRFEFYSTASNTKVIAATLTESSPTPFPLTSAIKVNSSIGTTGIAPLYMSVNRTGNQWTQSYSTNGTNWNVATTFAHTLMVTSVGTYAGNAGSSPAHTSSVDYFFNTAAPVSPEDAHCTEWLGTIDSDWNNNDNWSLSPPTQSSSGLIPDVSSSTNIFPEIVGSANCLDLIIEAGATLDIGVNGKLTIYGTFLNDGGITIHSDATGTGSLIDNGLISGTGAANVERYLSDDRWHYISAPVDDPTAQVFLGMYMMEWDEPLGEWSFISDPNYVMSTDMQGFGIWTYDPGPVTFVGDLNTGPKSMSTTNTFGAPHNNKGFNFSGNPFPSALNWNVDDGKGWSRLAGNIDPSIYIWNESAGNYGVYVKDGASGTNGVDSIIPPHQGFYVHSSAATGYIGVDNGARTHASKDILKKVYTGSCPSIILGVSGNNFSDETIIRIDDRASINFDSQFDALKFRGSADAPQLYSLLPDNLELSIHSFPADDSYSSIPLGLEAGIEAIYTIAVNDINGFESTDNIYLEDLKTGIFTEFNTNGSYNFTAGADDEPLRFKLHLNMEKPIPQIGNELIHIYSYDKNVNVLAPFDTQGTITIHNIMGQQIKKTEINGTTTVIPIDKSACYVVKVISNKGVVSNKVIVK